MSGVAVADASGVTWGVRRRWLPWRRPLSLREMWHSSSDSAAATESSPEAPEAEEDTSGPVWRFLQLTVGLAVWAIIGAGKLVFILGAAVLVLVVWLLDTTIQLAVLPFVLIARALGVARWPVQIDRDYAHFRTERADGFASAAALRDQVAAQIVAGTLAGMHDVDETNTTG